ncbi:MAG: phosphoribosylformylglycinamidine synthase [Bacteroidales bacterium]|nr:phosphoribosylformylglycinamidine synthase [Bacteroidales bacterium]MCF8377359.1 phosphoribosylformylglycinamidine synthase [Bacteroidales bacterium]MCF8401380.1 phosphoribosylformylglycinamidine synthase [Bacteroidales bacterium]
MIRFFRGEHDAIIAVHKKDTFHKQDIEKLNWLFSGAELLDAKSMEGFYVGPRKEMITPWSSNAVDITRNMGIEGIERMEQFIKAKNRDADFDPMLQAFYDGLDQNIFTIDKHPDPIIGIDDIKEYNEREGLALSPDEIEYLENVSSQIGRKLTDSEVYGFAQINSEHCRHKIFNGTFIIDGKEMKDSLFALIKKTSKENPNRLVSAYKDNVAFILGPKVEQFAPESQDKAALFRTTDIDTVISIKAETHNFPTTVEPFNGASTGTGGEIRDRMAGGKGSLPLAGTAVYMTSYPRPGGPRAWEKATKARNWLYQSPEEILIKASNGASDFGNKFGQPLINGSLLTFEHFEETKKFGYDKVIMLAGGVGFGKKDDSMKDAPEQGDVIVVLGGDNYRIGMGGGAVSSVATGEYGNTIELNAVQRANPEMQKRVYNAIRAMAEDKQNKIVSIHDHGAGGHLNSLSELVEETGGSIDIGKLPVGDPTLSFKEILGNESQERMGLVMKEKNIEEFRKVCERERAPFYPAGKVTNDHILKFYKDNEAPVDINMEYLFGKPPKTVLADSTPTTQYPEVRYDQEKFVTYLENVLQLEAVACKDWLTSKVDRSVTGRVAKQQCAGRIQLPLNNLGVMALDFRGEKGVATAMGHAPVAALIDPAKGSVLSVAEALTNIIWAPIEESLKGVSLSANWMWPAKNEGENARLYRAAQSISDFACKLGINIPTGKDSLSMAQKYPDGETVFSPGSVIVSAAGEVSDIRKVVEPVLKEDDQSILYYVGLSKDDFSLGGSSFAQSLNQLGSDCPDVIDPDYFRKVFNRIQQLIREEKILAGHDVSAGGLITALLEMTFTSNTTGLDVDLSGLDGHLIEVLFSENPALLIQVNDADYIEQAFRDDGIEFFAIGKVNSERAFNLSFAEKKYKLDIDHLRDLWYKSSYLLDRRQSGENMALKRYENYKKQELSFVFPEDFSGKASQYGIDLKRKEQTGVRAAIIREQGVNGDREMAYVMHLAGFDVKDIHMSDLMTGREDLNDVNFIVFVGGFANSDVLGSAKGWAGAFRYNEKAKTALENFYKRKDTLSLGVCNGCQLMMELKLLYPAMEKHPHMRWNKSHKFESGFINVEVSENKSVMMGSLAGTRLGIHVAHGEGQFVFEGDVSQYEIPMKYSYDEYPGNPNGSPFSIASMCSSDGRHLVMMPHLERAFLPWQWAYYPGERKQDEITPWVEAFVNAKRWIEGV